MANGNQGHVVIEPEPLAAMRAEEFEDCPLYTSKLTLWSCNDMIRPKELKEGQETWYISQAIERFRELHPNVTIEINAYNDNAQLMNCLLYTSRCV